LGAQAPHNYCIIVGRITEEQDPGYTIVWEEEEKEE
jgi:hypothetical protein